MRRIMRSLPGMNELSIKHKIVLISVCTTMLALVMSAVIIIVADYARQRAKMVEATSVLSSLVSFNAGAALAFRDPEVASDVLSGFSLLPDVVEATIFLPDGKEFVTYRSQQERHKDLLVVAAGQPESQDLSFSNAAVMNPGRPVFSRFFMDYSKPIFFGNTRQGVIAIRADLGSIYSHIAFSIVVTLCSLLIALLISVFVSQRLQKSVSRPIAELAGAFREVSSSKDYSKRLLLLARDEIGDLATGFNTMLEVVGERDREMGNLVRELKEATETKSAFLANMSHEIRTPLHGILGITSLLLEASEDSKDQKYFQTIDHSARTLLQIINDILDLSRIEADRFEPEIEQFSIKDVVENIVGLLAPVAIEKGVTLSVLMGENVPSDLKGDSRRLMQILVNLVGNALKFTGAGSVELKISMQDAVESGFLLLFEVTDTGIGISEESQVGIFNDFSQVDDSISRRFGGTGLGLSVSKSIVELLSGEIGVQSTEGEGSRFWFRLPFEAASVERTGAGLMSTVSDGQSNPMEGKPKKKYSGKVLLADDSDVNRFIMIETLKSYGIEAMAVEDGVGAVKAASTGVFDMIILDIQMPDIDGMEAARQIRNSNANVAVDKATPIIAFTASAMQGDRERFLEAGMDDYLSKPMQNEQLQSVLARWLGELET